MEKKKSKLYLKIAVKVIQINSLKVINFIKKQYTWIRQFVQRIIKKSVKFLHNHASQVRLWGGVVLVIAVGLSILIPVIIDYREKKAYEKEKSEHITIGRTDLKIYYSRGSRDDDKIEKYEFYVNDPIQALISFQDADQKTVVLYELIHINSGDVKHTVEIPLEGIGERYITVSSTGWNLTSGEYSIKISQAGYTLAEKSFSIE